MINRTLRDQPNNSPCLIHPFYPRPRNKTRPGPYPPLAPRDSPRLDLNIRPNPFNLAKASPLCPPSPNSPPHPLPPNHSRPSLNPPWGVGRTKPNTTTENSSLLFNRSPWLNSPSSPTLSSTRHPSPHPLHRYNLLSIPHLQNLQINQH